VDFLVRVPKRLRFISRTVDGEVSAHMLEQDVDVRAETATGIVSSEFPLVVHSDHIRGLLASGHVGHSHRMLCLKTGTGNIHLQRVTQVF
jgi:hypothetical protein